MPLVERILNVADDGVSAPPSYPHPGYRINSNMIYTIIVELMDGRRTVQQIKDFFLMDTACAAEFDTLVATAPTGTTTAARLAKLEFINKVHSITMIAERRAPTYSTPAEVRTKLGI